MYHMIHVSMEASARRAHFESYHFFWSWKNWLSINMPSEKQYLFLIRRLATGEFWTQTVPFVWQRVNRLRYIKHSVTAKSAIHIQQNVICEHQQVCLRAKYKRAKTELCHQATLPGAVLPPTTWLANRSTKGEFVGYVHVFSRLHPAMIKWSSFGCDYAEK